MSNKEQPVPSALQAWASTVMSGSDGADPEKVGEVDRAPGQAHYDPADVISVFMSARESAKQRLANSRRPPRATGR
ncbi:hypothetical protein [Nocardioides dilutus]